MYFISMLADALRQPNCKHKISEILAKIEKLGQNQHYRQGLFQFQRFMAEVRKHWESGYSKSYDISPYTLRDLALRLATSILEDEQNDAQTILNLIRTQPRLRRDFNKLRLEASKSEADDQIKKIVVEQDGNHFYSLQFNLKPVTGRIKKVEPGRYVVRFNTGRIIWQGDLTEQELIWDKAFPERELELAADTGDAPPIATKEITLFNKEITIKVIPGIESGNIEISIKRQVYEL
jgi:hypothetical protein